MGILIYIMCIVVLILCIIIDPYKTILDDKPATWNNWEMKWLFGKEIINGYQLPISVNIYAKKGTKVSLITKEGEIWNGTDYDKKEVMKYLKIGETYTVSRIDVLNWSSSVYLKEVPNIPFNSVSFYEVKK